MTTLILTAIKKRWLLLIFFILIAGFGYYCWQQLSIEAYPDIADVSAQVITQVPGLAAEEMEQQITIPVERALNATPGMKVMRSKSTFGLSIVTLVFEDKRDNYWARQRVTERLGSLNLPYNAKPGLDPLTSPIGEVYRYILESDAYDLRALTDLQNWVIIPRIKQVAGVTNVTNFGGILTQFQIELQPRRLEQYKISLGDIQSAILNNNANAGGSLLNQGDMGYVVRGIGLVKTLEGLGDIVVTTVGGVPVYLKDLGELKYGSLERKGVLGFTDKQVDHSESIEGVVQLLRGENPSAVLKDIHTAIDDLNQHTLPKGVTIRPYMDRTELVDTTLHTVSHTLLEGMGLVIVVLIVFLGNWRGALLVAITIPVALLIAFILMYFTDIPANLLSLGAIDFGIIVDGAIVMMETILKKREDDPAEELQQLSIAEKVALVAKPVLFATIIIITAYLPLFAFERVERKLFTPMAFTVSYALVGALLAAIVLIPGLAYMVYRKPGKLHHNKWLEKMTLLYETRIEKIMRKPRLILIPLACIFTGAVVLFITVGKDFLPTLDEGSIWLQVQLPPGISIHKSMEMSDSLRQRTIKHDEVSFMMVHAGRNDDGTDPWSASHFECFVGLKPYASWPGGKTKSMLIGELAREYATMPGYTVGFSQPMIDNVQDMISGAHSELVVKVYGEDFLQTRKLAEQVLNLLRSVPGAADLSIDQEPPLPQLQIKIDREALARYGLNIGDVTGLIEVAIGGKTISQLFQGNKVYDIICRYKEDARDTPEKIAALQLSSQSGARIPLSQVATVTTSTGESIITREMNRRHLTVKLNLRGRDLSSFLEEARSRIEKDIQYDHSQFAVVWGGQFENQQRAFARLAIVIPLTLAAMFLLLFGAFGKFRYAALIISVVPLALFGGLAALNIRGMTLNVSSAVGFIALFGVAIQNGVIMISSINDWRKQGFNLQKAIIRGAVGRFRPVLMTATVAILGLLPASLATGIGSDVQRPLATVIVYGLLAATVITLFALPALYYLVERKWGIKAKIVALIIALPIFSNHANAQADTSFRRRSISHLQFLSMVSSNNLSYAAEKFNIDLATAAVEAAKVFPDPSLSVSWVDNGQRRMKMGYGVSTSVSWLLELGGKRQARKELATNQLGLTGLLVENFYRNLRADATIAYLQAALQQELLKATTDSYNNMSLLARADSIRYKMGEIKEIDARQSRLEAGILLNEVYKAEANWRSAIVNLQTLLGKSSDTTYYPEDKPFKIDRAFDLKELIHTAVLNRPDMKAAARNQDLAQSMIRLARANRVIDLGLNMGVTSNGAVLNQVSPTPSTNVISAGVTIPLKFSGKYKAELLSAHYASLQADTRSKQTGIQVEAEVTAAYYSFLGAKQQVRQFDSGLLQEAKTTLEGKVFAYRAGETSLLEVLNALRTYNEIKLNYSESSTAWAISLVELERAAGIWDIQL